MRGWSMPESTTATVWPTPVTEAPGLEDVPVGVERARPPIVVGQLWPVLSKAPVGRRSGSAAASSGRRVELRVDDVGVGVEVAQRVGDVARLGGDDLGAREAQRLDQPHVGVGADVGALGGGQAGLALDDDAAWWGSRLRYARKQGEQEERERESIDNPP